MHLNNKQMATLTEQLRKIENDITRVLSENSNKAMTQDQLFDKTHLENMSYYGWSFALSNLEKAGKIKNTGVISGGDLLYALS